MARDATPTAILAGVTALVVTASLVPLPRPPGGGTAGGAVPAGLDKLLHAVGYLAVAYALAATLDARRTGRAAGPTLLASAVAGATLLGGGVELAQAAVPGRTPSALDALANLVGAAAGAAAWRLRSVGPRERGGRARERAGEGDGPG